VSYGGCGNPLKDLKFTIVRDSLQRPKGVQLLQPPEIRAMITDLVIDELSDKLVVGMNEFSLAISLSVLPQSDVAGRGVGVRV